MKKYISILLCVVLALCLVSCANHNANIQTDDENSTTIAQNSTALQNEAEQGENNENNSTTGNGSTEKESDKIVKGKSLVVYFSCTGNTAQMADYISIEADADLCEIEPKKPYTNEDLDYSNANSRSSVEQKDAKSRPEIAYDIDDFSTYEIIYLGYPIWFGDAPRIIYTFLESYDFSGKTIIPFCTSAQTDIDQSVENIKKIVPNANVKKGKRFAPSALQKDISKWLKKLA